MSEALGSCAKWLGLHPEGDRTLWEFPAQVTRSDLPSGKICLAAEFRRMGSRVVSL
jgi:hypothetical protein